MARWICSSMVSGKGVAFGVTDRIGAADGGGGSLTVRRTLSLAVPPGPLAVAT